MVAREGDIARHRPLTSSYLLAGLFAVLFVSTLLCLYRHAFEALLARGRAFLLSSLLLFAQAVLPPSPYFAPFLLLSLSTRDNDVPLVSN